MGASCLSSRTALISITGRHGRPTRLLGPSKRRLRQTKNLLQMALSMTRKTCYGITSVSSITQRPCTNCGHRTVSSPCFSLFFLALDSHHVVLFSRGFVWINQSLKSFLSLSSNLLLNPRNADPNFRKKAPKFTGIRIMSQDAWEALIGFICSSNNNISRISQMVCEHRSSPTTAHRR